MIKKRIISAVKNITCGCITVTKPLGQTTILLIIEAIKKRVNISFWWAKKVEERNWMTIHLDLKSRHRNVFLFSLLCDLFQRSAMQFWTVQCCHVCTIKTPWGQLSHMGKKYQAKVRGKRTGGDDYRSKTEFFPNVFTLSQTISLSPVDMIANMNTQRLCKQFTE